MLSVYKSKAKPIADFLSKPFMGVSPNILTTVGLIIPTVFFLLMVTGKYFWAVVIYPFVLLDFIDGHVARTTGKVTRFGGVFDSTLDRVSDALIIGSFGFSKLVSWGIVLPLIVLSLVISYVRSRAEFAGGGNFKMDVGIIERPERIGLIYISMLLFYIFPTASVGSGTFIEVGLFVLLVLSVVTVVQRLYVAYRKLS